MVAYSGLGVIFVTTPLTISMHGTAVLLGIGSLGVGAAVKKTPPAWLNIFPQLNESKDEAGFGAYEETFQQSKTALLMDEV